MRLTFTVEVNEQGLAEHYAQYPELAALDDRSPAKTLIREAIAAWDFEALIASATGDALRDAVQAQR